ncbi:MAG: hypothetical protein COT74_05760 [Bdellovibrionales bacterium CG10_big_fil_rev_8_21_14_0_10_45_34]|nr:MAG: hypothetical protein COT74_05760 [Bdellovibrionales bacterium CG10_big_fil_rev_8_21_14_0_10_45_34]
MASFSLRIFLNPDLIDTTERTETLVEKISVEKIGLEKKLAEKAKATYLDVCPRVMPVEDVIALVKSEAKKNRRTEKAESLGLRHSTETRSETTEISMILTRIGWRLFWVDQSGFNEFGLDFHSGPMVARRKSVGKFQPLAKAIGGKPNENCVIDATCGFGIDTLDLLQLGYKVLPIEKSLITGELFEEAVDRSQIRNENLHPLVVDDAIALLGLTATPSDAGRFFWSETYSQFSGGRPAVIYFDFLFDDLSKKGAPDKKMKLLHLLGDKIHTLESVLQNKSLLKSQPVSRLVFKIPAAEASSLRKYGRIFESKMVSFLITHP